MTEIRNTSCISIPQILVIGIGGGGNNALDRMINSNVENVTFAGINTDLQVLESCQAEIKLQIGQKITNGFGAGSDPSIGKAAAAENEEELIELVKDFDMVILTCGMGGGTGTGATPFLAKLCKDNGILTVAVVTTPFTFESAPRTAASQTGIEELKKNVDTLLVIPNDKLLTLTDKPFFLQDAFAMADTVLKYTIEGITNIIFNRGIVNLDFNDLKTTLLNKGIGHLGIGTTTADGSILEALKQAINSPLLDTSIAGATNILINSSGNINLTELDEAISHVRDLAGNNVNVIWGTVAADNFDMDKIVVTLIATGMQEKSPTSSLRISPPKQVGMLHSNTAFAMPKNKNMEITIPTFLQSHMK
ncbi:MAG: cell division protein FtsZ [Lachnospiraceae bacterium]|nr:cell division protein FtsZ [Lachnospiraceae bacterium]